MGAARPVRRAQRPALWRARPAARVSRAAPVRRAAEPLCAAVRGTARGARRRAARDAQPGRPGRSVDRRRGRPAVRPFGGPYAGMRSGSRRRHRRRIHGPLLSAARHRVADGRRSARLARGQPDGDLSRVQHAERDPPGVGDAPRRRCAATRADRRLARGLRPGWRARREHRPRNFWHARGERRVGRHARARRRLAGALTARAPAARPRARRPLDAVAQRTLPCPDPRLHAERRRKCSAGDARAVLRPRPPAVAGLGGGFLSAATSQPRRCRCRSGCGS